MTTNKKILCDYCNFEQDSILTGNRSIAGSKIYEILRQVTRRTIPTTIPIRLCQTCASTLQLAAATIAKADEVVNKLLPGAAGKQKKIETDVKTGANFEGVVTNIEATPVGQTPAKIKTANKNQSLSNESPSSVKQSGKQNLPNASKPVAVPSTPSKQQCSDASLKQTPAKAKNTTNFKCIHCVYASSDPSEITDHYKIVHNQKRPRIYKCSFCVKTFSVETSLKKHLNECDLVERKKEMQNPVPDLQNLKLSSVTLEYRP